MADQRHLRPGVAARRVATPPIAPPRPPSTLSPATRDLRGEEEDKEDTVRVLLPPLPRSSSNAGSSPSTPWTMTTATSLSSSSTMATTTTTSASASISLRSPRPDGERRENFYVEAPLARSPLLHSPLTSTPLATASPSASSSRSAAASPKPSSFSSSSSSPSSVILSPPSSTSKSPSEWLETSKTSTSSTSEPPRSIICRECGRCKCAACRVRRRLPERWLCGGQCRLSADGLVDCLSCMSLIRAAAYHCTKDRQRAEERRSSCQWLLMGVASVTCLLPCLWCYWPLRGCVRAAESVYEKRTSNSCTCDDDDTRHNVDDHQHHDDHVDVVVHSNLS